MSLLESIKVVLRISNTAYDSEINDLIAAAKADLKLAGVLESKINDETDPLIKRAIIVFVKTHFGWNNSDAERLQRSYDMLKSHLTLSKEYTEEAQ